MQEAAAIVVAPSSTLQDLAEIRQRHHQLYREREEAAERAAKEREERAEREGQEQRDAELAARLAEDEDEARLRQLEADEEYSRQLAMQLNPGAAEHPLQDLSSTPDRGGNPTPIVDLDRDITAQYHQMEDNDGYRAPMRTGYVDRLIEEPQDRLGVPTLGSAGLRARQLALQQRFGRWGEPRTLLLLVCAAALGAALLAALLLWADGGGRDGGDR